MATISTTIPTTISTVISTTMYGATWVQEDDKKANGELHKKVWKPRAAKEDNQMYEPQFKGERRSLQNKVWDVGKTKNKRLLIKRSIIFLPWESDAGASDLHHMIEDLGN